MTDIPHQDRLLTRSQAGNTAPFLTVAIPHHNRRKYLELVLASLFEQDYEDFEIVVSDDGSNDDSNEVIPRLLQQSGCAFRYYAQAENLGYDGNVRFCLSASLGRYVLLLGNDDALHTPTVLRDVTGAIRQLDFPEVAFVNFGDWGSAEIVRRARLTRILGAGPETAARYFRSFSFVSGLIYDRAQAIKYETNRWDNSIYYQIYIACRIIASGGRLASLDIIAIRKNVLIDGEPVPNYATRAALAGWSLKARHTGLDSVIRVAVDAVLPFTPESARSSLQRRIIAQILLVTYPYWLFEYRRVGNWSLAAGIARGMWPTTVIAEYTLARRDRVMLWLLYLGVSLIGLTVPASLFNRARAPLADAVRRVMQPKDARRRAR